MENQIYLITVKQPIWKQVLVHNKEDNLRHLYNWIVPFSITAPSLKYCSFRNNKYPVDTLRHCLGSRMLFTFVAANVTDLGNPGVHAREIWWVWRNSSSVATWKQDTYLWLMNLISHNLNNKVKVRNSFPIDAFKILIYIRLKIQGTILAE